MRAEIIQISVPQKNIVENKNTKETVLAENISNSGQVDIYREHPLPEEILSEINNLPEFQKQEFLSNYIGLNVKWQLSLFSMIQKGNMVQLNLVSSKALLLPIICEVNLSDYPELKIIKKDHDILVSGSISKISTPLHIINLSNCILEIR